MKNGDLVEFKGWGIAGCKFTNWGNGGIVGKIEEIITTIMGEEVEEKYWNARVVDSKTGDFLGMFRLTDLRIKS